MTALHIPNREAAIGEDMQTTSTEKPEVCKRIIANYVENGIHTIIVECKSEYRRWVFMESTDANGQVKVELFPNIEYYAPSADESSESPLRPARQDLDFHRLAPR